MQYTVTHASSLNTMLTPELKTMRNLHLAAVLMLTAIVPACLRNQPADDPNQPTILRGHRSCVCSVAFFPSGKMLATAGGDSVIKLWSVPEGAEIATLRGHTIGVLALAVSPDGSLLASGGQDYNAILWDLHFLRRTNGQAA